MLHWCNPSKKRARLVKTSENPKVQEPIIEESDATGSHGNWVTLNWRSMAKSVTNILEQYFKMDKREAKMYSQYGPQRDLNSVVEDKTKGYGYLISCAYQDTHNQMPDQERNTNVYNCRDVICWIIPKLCERMRQDGVLFSNVQ